MLRVKGHTYSLHMYRSTYINCILFILFTRRNYMYANMHVLLYAGVGWGILQSPVKMLVDGVFLDVDLNVSGGIS